MLGGGTQEMIMFRGSLIIPMHKEGEGHRKTGSSIFFFFASQGSWERENAPKLRTVKDLNKTCSCLTVGGTTARMCQAVHLALFASDRDPREGHTIISHNSQIRLREIQSQSLAHGQQMRSEMVGTDIREAWGCQGEWHGG